MISRNEIRNRARAFSKEWERDFNEDAEAKSFWDGFFEVFGMSRRRVATFEHRVKKQDTHDGYIDVFWKGTMLAEHKSKGKDLNKAYNQAKHYLPGIKDEDLPRYIVISDFQKIRVYDVEDGKDTEFDLKDLHSNINLFDFISGYVTDVDYEKEEEVSIKAARLMASFHNEIAKTGYSGHELEVFLVRTLFCLFADDTDIFNKNIFRVYLNKRTSVDGSDLGLHLSQIFQVLATPNDKRQSTLDEQLAEFPYINGGIFKETISMVSFDAEARKKLLDCCSFDWSQISASIFGSLFQGVMNEDERRKLGAHYTSERNIMKVIHSLFLDELYIEFDQVKNNKKKLEEFHVKLSTLTFLDPACGCGNFLVVTYRELRKLELEVLLKKRGKDNRMQMFGVEDISRININQCYGIEIEEFPVQVARLALYLVDHQMNNILSETFGINYARIPLREPATIVHGDSLVLDWEQVVPKERLTYILGNPPFVGARIMSKEQKEIFSNVFDNAKGVGNLDFVTAWYEKAARYTAGTVIKTAFVSTNSICQGEQVSLLWKRLKEKYGVVIHFAHQTFKWNNDAPGVAAVYCIIVGFATFDVEKKYLYEYETIKSEPKEKEVGHINAYLMEGEDIFLESRRKPICNVPEMSYGSMSNDGGFLLLSKEEKDLLLSIDIKAEKFIRPYLMGEELINNIPRYCLWLLGVEPSELRLIPEILKRIECVKKIRSESSRQKTKELALTPALFAEIRQPKEKYIALPRVSSARRNYIPVVILESNIIVGDKVYTINTASSYSFGVMTSQMHMDWMRYTAGRLKSDYSYTNTITYNNFPWPENVTEDQNKKVEECAQGVLDARLLFPKSSLADLYDPNTMPPELVKAHNDLDKAVDACYGRKFASKEERIEFLFDLYKKYISK